jgi:hypothetical protein
MVDALDINQSVSKAGESVDQVMELVLKNGRITVLEFANMLEILFRSVQSIFKDSLYVCQIAANLVFCLLNEECESHRTSCVCRGQH